MVIQDGIYPGLGMETYHAWKVDKENLKDSPVSCSFLKSFAANPYEWLHSAPFKQTDGMRVGSLYDLALTDPFEIQNQVVTSPFDSFRTKESQTWRDEQISAGKIIISGDELIRAQKAALEVNQHPIAGDILNKAQFQVGIIGKIDGINAKALLDILPSADGEWGDCVVDYKTTANGLDNESLAQTMGKFKYGWQAAWYCGLANKFLRPTKRFVFIWQSTKTLEVRVTTLSLGSTAMLDGDKCIAKALAEFKKCAEFGITSRYAYKVDQVDIKPYHAMQEEEMEVEL
jgi:hypothetical protein